MYTRMKHLLLPSLLLCGALLAACSQKAAQTSTSEPESVVTDSTQVLLEDGTPVTWLQDNQGHRLMERSLFPEASDSLFEALGLQEGVPSSVSTFLMRSEGEWVLFDAGLGAANGGQLLLKLAERGLTPDSISLVYLTHFHFDHIGGMLDAEMKPTFPQAEVYAGAIEYDAWIHQMPADQNAMQRLVMEAYEPHLHLYQFGDTLPHGVIALDAIGHTPGHTAFRKSNLLVIGDLMHGAALQLEHPEISVNFDMDKAQAAQSRQRILQLAADEHLLMAGMHLPEPAFIQE